MTEACDGVVTRLSAAAAVRLAGRLASRLTKQAGVERVATFAQAKSVARKIRSVVTKAKLCEQRSVRLDLSHTLTRFPCSFESRCMCFY